jgi:hypothetical protein
MLRSVRPREVVLSVALVTWGMVLGVIGSIIPPARAEPIAPDVSIGCSGLGDRERAALDARARAELASAPSVGRVTFACGDASALITVEDRNSGTKESTVSLSATPMVTVERLLTALRADLALHATAVEPSDAGAHAAPAFPARPVVLLSTNQSRPLDRLDVMMTPPGPKSGLFGIIAATDFELWQGSQEMALGARAGGRLALAHNWSLSVLAGLGVGVGSSDGVSAHVWSGTVRIDHLLLDWVDVGLGIGAQQLVARRPSASSEDLVGASLEGIASARARLPLGAVALAIGPDLELLTQPLVVRVDGHELFRVPRIVGALSLEATYEFAP